MTESSISTSPTVLFISTFQFSGSTLASLLLNSHSKITTIGHTTGWDFGDDAGFRCSCGALLADCKFFRTIEESFVSSGLDFDIRDFGTDYRLADDERVNRYLLESLPIFENSRLERCRDSIVRRLPGVRRRLNRQDRANLVLFSTALAYSAATVIVDNSHDPYRLRRLARIAELKVHNMHLVRDPRGAALSCMTHTGMKPDLATRIWVRRQKDIFRISEELREPSLLIYYEDLCSDVNRTLAQIHEFIGLGHEAFPGRFDASEHHILGNDMRLRDPVVKPDERWTTELTAADLATINSMLDRTAMRYGNSPVAELIRHYL